MELHLECKPDECLRTLNAQRKVVDHNDKGRVCNHLKKNAEQKGMIDDDPGSAQPSYLAGLAIVSNNHNIRVLRDAQKANEIIIVSPRLEDWVINVCKLNKVDMDKFGLSNRPNQLHREINSKLRNFNALILFLQARNAPQINYLTGLL